MEPIIYFRKHLTDNEELLAAKKYFHCTNLLTNIQPNQLVIGRYSLLPFYFDQESEIKNIGSQLINNYNQHLYIADLQNYVQDLGELTPKTWLNLYDLPEEGPFILKGATNSRKADWKTAMFAADKKAAIDVHGELSRDSLIGSQNIYIRQYIPLVKYMDGINGMPVTKEFRFFIVYGQIICGDYYWSNYVDDLATKPLASEVPLDFLDKVITRVGDQSNFYTIDVGQTLTGDWIVIELNEGQQAGLSCNDPDIFYANLKKAIEL